MVPPRAKSLLLCGPVELERRYLPSNDSEVRSSGYQLQTFWLEREKREEKGVTGPKQFQNGEAPWVSRREVHPLWLTALPLNHLSFVLKDSVYSPLSVFLSPFPACPRFGI